MRTKPVRSGIEAAAVIMLGNGMKVIMIDVIWKRWRVWTKWMKDERLMKDENQQ